MGRIFKLTFTDYSQIIVLRSNFPVFNGSKNTEKLKYRYAVKPPSNFTDIFKKGLIDIVIPIQGR
jgi:hypothetical protein